jgi:HSP20 family protein
MDLKNLIPFGKKDLQIRREDDTPFSMMQREMNRMFDAFNHNWGLGVFPEFAGAVMPRLDVTEDAKAFTVTAELPGINEKDIDLSISGDTLTITGEKKEEKEDGDKNKSYYYSERSYGAFSRSITLPRQIEIDKVAASFKKGVLTITLPKTAAAVEATKKIDVKLA